VRTLEFLLSGSICLIVLRAVSTESDSTGDRRQRRTNVSPRTSGLFPKQENRKARKESNYSEACDSQNQD